MNEERTSSKRFVILPGRGISGPAMEASVFKPGARGALKRVFEAELPVSAAAAPGVRLATARSAASELAARLDEEDFEVISQRFQDGSAMVRMTQAAKLALEASNPDVRVFPITQYSLPGYSFRRMKAAPAGVAAAVTAVQDDGSIFHDDAKQHFLNGTDPGQAGAGVLIGILDTGIDSSHPALAGRIAVSRCFIPGVPPGAGGPVDWGPAAAPRAGHGTHVAGIIAAQPGHGGPAGVAPAAQLISYRIFPDNPAGRSGAENAVIIESIRGAIDDGCHVINLSIEGATLREDGVRSAISEAWQQGVICIAASGNGFGNPVSFPAALPHCVAVTAVGRDGGFPPLPDFMTHVSDQRAGSDAGIFLAAFSNFGPKVQFTAPGHAIVSTFPNGEWWFNSGTSMAAPFVTGMLARFLSDNSNILNAFGNAQRSGAMLQMLVGRSRILELPQRAHEGYGLPV